MPYGSPVYSSVATDAEYVDRFTSDDESLYDVVTEGENRTESVTPAIGDGANGGGMIHTAHIESGSVAVNASDYALAQFRFLQRLLFVHGRWAYRRVAKIMSYMLYKNVTYVLITFWFGCFCGFSGQPLILDVACQSFYVLYTRVPLVFGLSTHDQPVIATNSGKSGGLTTLGFVVFTNLVVVNLKLFLETFMLTWHFLLAIAVSILLWFDVGFPFRNQMLDFNKLLAKCNT
ncbi:hypothetical protein PsorP6_000615 [Peronosclerospora sorghi]|uniref:Uncharacterized protein n=1 Tax=Peronosclerospora sorghi TaxID=230839 RepID=A0ACC0WPX1_9STRA|nr:hypothetical protein PsorP6_000615 [Peronosclerospora sorghi]